MKKNIFLNNPHYAYDPSLDDDEINDPNPFPEKMARAVAFLEKNGLPPDLERTHRLKKPARSTLQNELLTVFALDSTAEQMQELTTFLYQLFGEQLKAAKIEEEEAVPA